ncbi:MAG TPA: ferrous iron transport protein A [Firmicutes bacterium]|nr:ferrous iron transport protein A [Candidatus Fermentithermobacillaceae bacterium]
MTLLETKPGDEVIIDTTRAGRGAARRLWDLGLLPGTKVKTIASHPFQGPILVKVGESTVAVGRRLAARIRVSK